MNVSISSNFSELLKHTYSPNMKYSSIPVMNVSIRQLKKGALKQHQESKHEGVVYLCNQCNYKTTQQSNLRRHTQSKHEGVKYSCIECDYQSGFQSGLKRHQQSKHEICLLLSS